MNEYLEKMGRLTQGKSVPLLLICFVITILVIEEKVDNAFRKSGSEKAPVYIRIKICTREKTVSVRIYRIVPYRAWILKHFLVT